jgi:hypothetical protein
MHVESLQRLDCNLARGTTYLLDDSLRQIPLTYILCGIVTLTEHIDAKQSNQAQPLPLQEQ